MNRLTLVLFLTASTLFAAKETPPTAQGATADLARVAIMQFENDSKSANYEWVEKSLPDAINDSMRARFEFIRQDENKVAAVAGKYKLVNGEYVQADADKIARESQSDILIFGNFRLNETGDKLVLRAVIYNAQGKKVIGIVEDTTSLDSKIFKAIDRLAEHRRDRRRDRRQPVARSSGADVERRRARCATRSCSTIDSRCSRPRSPTRRDRRTPTRRACPTTSAARSRGSARRQRATAPRVKERRSSPLPHDHDGPARPRTWDQPVMSRPL